MIGRLFISLWIVVGGAVVMWAQSKPDDPAQLKQALAQCTNRLGAANSELGSLQQLQAAAISGTFASVQDSRAAFKSQFETANPGKTLDDEMKVVPKPSTDAGGKK